MARKLQMNRSLRIWILFILFELAFCRWRHHQTQTVLLESSLMQKQHWASLPLPCNLLWVQGKSTKLLDFCLQIIKRINIQDIKYSPPTTAGSPQSAIFGSCCFSLQASFNAILNEFDFKICWTKEFDKSLAVIFLFNKQTIYNYFWLIVFSCDVVIVMLMVCVVCGRNTTFYALKKWK